MIEIIAIDTNIIIKALAGTESCINAISGKLVAISIITEIELLSWPQLSETDYSVLRSFLEDCIIVDFSQEIKEEAIKIRKMYGLKVPDAIIAATAVTKKLSLFSGDDIFKRVLHLNFVHIQ